MFLIPFVVFFSLIGLMVLHEFGHFVLAKIFNVKVEEFGIGYPPRIFGKKFGQTLYSLNLLPFGAFVKIPGEIEKVEDSRSFSQQPLRKRVLIALGGVLSFWLISAMLFSIVFNLGARMAIEDNQNSGLIDPAVQINAIAAGSPAQIANLEPGDTVKELKIGNVKFKIEKVEELKNLIEQYKGREVTLTIERGKQVFEVSLIPRVLPPEDEGPMGVGLVRTAIKKYPWYQAIFQGILATGDLTLAIIQGYFQAISNLVRGLPSGVQMMGPVGISRLLAQASRLGLSYFLNFLGLISIYLALFNALPIPATDGGKTLFLGIEAVRKKPIAQETEQKITAAFFTVLILLAIWVTIKDIEGLF